MRAAVIADGSITIQDRPDPVPAADQLFVQVAAAGINRADLLQVRCRHPAPPEWPRHIPGLEFSGVSPNPARWRPPFGPGDRVFGIVGRGTHATHLLVPESLCVRVPDVIDLIEAGGIPEVGEVDVVTDLVGGNYLGVDVAVCSRGAESSWPASLPARPQPRIWVR